MNTLAHPQAVRALPAMRADASVFIFAASADVRTRLAAAVGAGGDVHAYADPGDAAAFAHMRRAGAGSVGIVAVEGLLLFFPAGAGCVACLHQVRLAQQVPHEIAAHRQGVAIDL